MRFNTSAILASLCLGFSLLFINVQASSSALEDRHLRFHRRAPAPVNQTRDTLDRIVRTYEWVQYQYQAIACRNTPAMYTDCSRVWQGSNIPGRSSVAPSNWAAQGGYSFTYSYTATTFYGFGVANYTSYEPQFVNITAQAMYFYCQTNTTCAQAYNSTAGIQKSLLNLVKQNSAIVKSILAKDPTKTWVPWPWYANGLSYFTSFPNPGAEILGVHNAVVFAATKYKASQMKALYALQERLRGGAQMYESLMNTLALINLDTASNQTTYTKRAAVHDLGAPGGLDRLRAQREKTFAELAKLRGDARTDLFESLNMKAGYSSLGVDISTHNGSNLKQRDTCSKTGQVSQYAISVQDNISRACAIADVVAHNPISTVFSLGRGVQALANGPFWKAAWGAGGVAISNTYGAVQFSSAMCSLLKGFQPCFPEESFWFSGSGGTAITLLSDLAGVATGNPLATVGVGIDVLCAANSEIFQAYTDALKCCASNCNSPQCTAGSVACAVPAAPC